MLPLPCQQTTAYHGNKVDVDDTEDRRTNRQLDRIRSLAFSQIFVCTQCKSS